MTHGNVYIWVDGKMLLCEACSDGYLSGVGFGALCSSKNIDTITRLSTIFYGSPFFYEPSTGKYIAKEGDYIIESYEEVVNSDNGFDEEMLKDASDTLDMVLSGDLEGAFKTRFAQVDLPRRMGWELSFDARVSEPDEEWQSFIEHSTVLPLPELCELLVSKYKENPALRVESDTSYFWRDGQFWTNVKTDSQEYFLMPLIVACAFSCGANCCYGDMAYLLDMTQPDKQALFTLLDTFKQHNLPVDGLFKGAATSMLNNLVLNDKLLSELSINEGQKNKAKI